MSRLVRFCFVVTLIAIGTVSSRAQGSGEVLLTSVDAVFTETFNSLSNGANNSTASTLPTGWYLSESGTNANTTYRTYWTQDFGTPR